MFILIILCSDCQVYVIDFGLAKRYRDSATNRHIPYRWANDFKTHCFRNYQFLFHFILIFAIVVIPVYFFDQLT